MLNDGLKLGDPRAESGIQAREQQGLDGSSLGWGPAALLAGASTLPAQRPCTSHQAAGNFRAQLYPLPELCWW